MSDAQASARELIGFDGPVDCCTLSGAVRLVLRGERQGARTELLFSGPVRLPEPPPAQRLHQVRVLEINSACSGAARRFCIESREGRFAIQAGAVQLHQQAAAALQHALPAARVPIGARLGWSWLLALLRLPGAARVLRRLRASGK